MVITRLLNHEWFLIKGSPLLTQCYKGAITFHWWFSTLAESPGELSKRGRDRGRGFVEWSEELSKTTNAQVSSQANQGPRGGAQTSVLDTRSSTESKVPPYLRSTALEDVDPSTTELEAPHDFKRTVTSKGPPGVTLLWEDKFLQALISSVSTRSNMPLQRP